MYGKEHNMALSNDQLQAEIDTKMMERMKAIKDIESSNLQIQGLNTQIQELQRAVAALNEKSMSLRVEIEQIEKLKAML